MQPSSDDRQESKAMHWLNRVWFLPLMALAGLLSIPVGGIMVAYYTLKETRFARKMKLAGRMMPEPQYAAALDDKRGTLIEEWFSNKGPVRYWWTEDDIPSVTPFARTAFGVEAVWGREYDEFSLWCHNKYLESNNARFVSASYVPNMIRPREDSKAAIAIPVVAIYRGRLSLRPVAR